MLAPVVIDIPLVKSQSPPESPIRIRLESWKRSDKSPEKRFEENVKRARQRLAEKVSKAKAHNEKAKAKVFHHRASEQENRERLRQRVDDAIDQAALRRANRVKRLKERNAEAAQRSHVVRTLKFDGLPTPPTAASPSATLLEQLERFKSSSADFDSLSSWLCEPSTLHLVRTCLDEFNAPNAKPRLVLGLCMMAIDHERLFDVEAFPPDGIMLREARRFYAKLLAALKTASSPAEATTTTTNKKAIEPFHESYRRASRFHAAWSAQDRPHTLSMLHASVVASSARQRELHPANRQAPEETIEHIRKIGGAEEAEEARRRFDGAWQQVTSARSLEETVKEIAERAFWDALSERVSHGEYEALFTVLGEMQEAMSSLIAHSPKALEELNDKFDAKWLEQMAKHDALDVGSVAGLMRYIATTLRSWQAPADDQEASEWLRGVEATLDDQKTASLTLPEFITSHLVPFLKGARRMMGLVYTRTVDLLAEREAAAGAGGSSSEAADID